MFLRAETGEANGDPPDGLLMFRATADNIPGWIPSLWPLDDLAAAYRGLTADLQPLFGALDAGDRLTGLDAMAARTLLIHHWRRIVLRDPGLPEALLPEGWPGEETRDVVRRVYRQVVPGSEAWLDGAGVAEVVDVTGFGARFG